MAVTQNIPKLRFPAFDGEWEKSKLNKFASLNPKNSELPESFIYIDLESVTDGLLIKENVISKSEAPSRAQRILKDKDILYQTVRPYQKNNLYFDKVGDYVASTGYAQIRTINDSQFLFQFLHSEKFVANVMLRCTGTSYPAINSSDLSSIEIAFPTLPEQQKIASFLSAIDEKIQQLSRKKELLLQYKKGVTQQLFSGKLRFKDENGEDYADWEEKILGEVAGKIGDGLHGTPIYSEDSDIYFINGNNLTNGKIEITEKTKKVDYTIFTKNDKGLSENTILISLNGTIGNIAKYNNEKVMLGKSVGYYNFKGNADFYYQFLKTETVQNFFVSELTGSTIKNLSLKTLRETIVHLPCLAEQNKIANFLSSIDTKIESTSQQITQTQNFKNGLLQQLFV